MLVAIVISEDWEVARCLPWAASFARGFSNSLMVLVLSKKRDTDHKAVELTGDQASEPSTAAGKTVLDFIAAQADFEAAGNDNPQESDDDNEQVADLSGPVSTQVVELVGGDPARAIFDEVVPRAVSLLILPRSASQGGLERETEWQREIFLHAPCQTMQLRPANEVDDLRAMLVPADGSPPSQAALRLAQRLAEVHDLPVTALYVEPEVGDMAHEVGQRIIDRIVSNTLANSQRVTTEVVVASSVRQAIADRADERIGLLLLGGDRRGLGRRWLRKSVSESLMARTDGPAVAVLRPAIPLASRLKTFLSRLLKSRVPQLDRERRVSLVERVQESSHWNFDFVALICLSTLIATLGLMQNSAAVVIGAMLVAPLMTPLVGAGLALVQGNRILICRASGTVLKGFVLAFGIALILGWVIPGSAQTSEMLARGSPTVLDFVVALVSGVAAAYALGRPNLLSALPGVAIAAALVPPVATAGLALAAMNISLMLGALLLFATNIVAIILGTAAALWAVGIRATHEHGMAESWVLRVSLALLLLAVVISVYEMVPHRAVPTELLQAIELELADHPNTELVSVTPVSPNRWRITISSNRPIDDHAARKIAEVVREVVGESVAVEVQTRLMTTMQPASS